ncbi:hypothetical protein M8J77_008666 [Diaphorina citri]|nr:hypothetical protein M8J77_008666 [Diaphorina citri]
MRIRLINQYQLLIYIILYLDYIAPRIVRTKYGDVSGVIINADNRYLDAVEVFRGIPYASAPVGNLRFMPPTTPETWKDVKPAHKFAPVCPQDFAAGATGGAVGAAAETPGAEKMRQPRLEMLRGYLRNQSEDCLYLNIYSPIRKECWKMESRMGMFICNWRRRGGGDEEEDEKEGVGEEEGGKRGGGEEEEGEEQKEEVGDEELEGEEEEELLL